MQCMVQIRERTKEPRPMNSTKKTPKIQTCRDCETKTNGSVRCEACQKLKDLIFAEAEKGA